MSLRLLTVATASTVRCAPLMSETQTLTVRQEDGTLRQEELVVRRSVHGPVVAERDGSPIALRLVAVDRWVSAAGVLEQWWEMGRAQSLAEFEAALRRLQLPLTTVLYADRDGHVLYVFTGQVPVRSSGDWEFWAGVVPGDTSATLWSTIHPYEDLPRVTNPPGGWVQNADEPPWTATLPSSCAEDFPPYMAPPLDFPGFRAQRSMLMLSEDPAMTLEELIENTYATEVEFAIRILDDLIGAARQAARRRTGQRRCWRRGTGGLMPAVVAPSSSWPGFRHWRKRQGSVTSSSPPRGVPRRRSTRPTVWLILMLR